MPFPSIAPPYVCFVHPVSGGVPYLDLFPACSKAGVVRHAVELLREHQDCAVVDFWREEELMFSLTRGELAKLQDKSAAA